LPPLFIQGLAAFIAGLQDDAHRTDRVSGQTVNAQGKGESGEVFMKILVGMAPGATQDKIIELAIIHATHFGAKVYLVTSLEGGSSTSEKDIEDAEKGLDYAKVRFEAQGLPCETHLIIRGNSPDQDLVEFAYEKNMDEIIVGARKRTPVGKAFLGSVTQKVALTASCPVVLAK
jgi:nucleotide-binding universal stress UspA family protein